ncbi:MAG TPA: DUF4292 domain-containing protein [Flavipsychrobacter sp.]|nr:DUF4292 domain-containing protein [Flavipsychrobacter sp.]
MNNNIPKLVFACILGGLLFQFSSCGIFKKGKKSKTKTAIVSTDTARQAVQPNAPAYSKALADKYVPVWKKEIDFNTFSGKAKCHFEGRGQNLDFTAHIRIKKNEATWVNITALGGIFNVARIYATPDSFTLINFADKTYTAMKTEDANKVIPFPVDFSMLQNLLIGNTLRQDGELKNIVENDNDVTLIVKKDNLNQEIAIGKNANSIGALKVYLDDDNSIANIKLGNYQNINSNNFPKDRVINVINQGNPYLLEMNYTDISFNGNVDMPFSIPKSFERK